MFYFRMFKLIFIVVVWWMLGCGFAMLCEKQVNISIAFPNASTWDCYIGGPSHSNRRVMFIGDVVCPLLLNWKSSVMDALLVVCVNRPKPYIDLIIL